MSTLKFLAAFQFRLDWYLGPDAAQPGVKPLGRSRARQRLHPRRPQSKVGLGFNEHIDPHGTTRSKIIPMGAGEITAHTRSCTTR
jgi:hypothetical protein